MIKEKLNKNTPQQAFLKMADPLISQPQNSIAELVEKIAVLIYGNAIKTMDKQPLKKEILAALELIPNGFLPKDDLEVTYLQQFLISRAMGMYLISQSHSKDRALALEYLKISESSLQKLDLSHC